MQLMIKGSIRFFLHLIWKSKWCTIFPWLHFVNETLFLRSLSSLQHHIHSIAGGIVMNRKQLRCKNQYQGCQLTPSILWYKFIRTFLPWLACQCSNIYLYFWSQANLCLPKCKILFAQWGARDWLRWTWNHSPNVAQRQTPTPILTIKFPVSLFGSD